MSTKRRFDTSRRVKGNQTGSESTIVERQPPHDLEAELGVLGSILLKPDVCDDISSLLRKDDFFDETHQVLFQHMLEMHSSGKRIDITLLVDHLKKAGDFETIGGAAFLARLSQVVPNAAHAKYYGNIVREKSIYRAIIDASTEILASGYEESQEAKDFLNFAEQRMFAVMNERMVSNVASISDVLVEAMERIDQRIRGTLASDAVETGFSDLDTMTGGLHNSELVILAARPSMGKTAFAMNIAENVSIDQAVPTLFVSLEMSSMELADRLLCSVGRINGHRLRNGTLPQDERRRLVAVAGKLSQAKLHVDDSPSRTVTEIAAAARRIKRQEGRIGLIVIDYLQLIEPDNPSDPRQEQVARIARRLKGLARELETPVLCLAQVNRQTEDAREHRPRLSHLRESGAIEQDADVVMFVHREEYYRRGEEQEQFAGQAEIIVAKQRNGPIGDLELVWRKDFTRFEDKAPERLEEFDEYSETASYPEF
ncbi:MAG: replicative DNA helicase [Planctomycetota bacterium]